LALWKWLKNKDAAKTDVLINDIDQGQIEEEDTPNGDTVAVIPSIIEAPPKNPEIGGKYYTRDKEGKKYEMTIQNIHELENGSFAVHSTGVLVDG
jgi:hypothetical protein